MKVNELEIFTLELKKNIFKEKERKAQRHFYCLRDKKIETRSMAEFPKNINRLF